MNFAVTITTCGREGMLERTLASFDLAVRPRPAEGYIVDDSGNPAYRRWLETIVDERGWTLVYHPMRRGFCETVADAWALAAQAASPWIFWLEDDFEFVRAVDLAELGNVLFNEPLVAQMALYRNPVNAEEVAAGGYVQLRPDTYARRGSGNVRWLEHTNHFTTNPSLFRRSLTQDVPWPGEESECEGRFGFKLRELWPELAFGLWGNGTLPHVRHIGARAGFGY